MQLLVFATLLSDIVAYRVLVSMFVDSDRKIAICPKLAAPKNFFTCGQRFKISLAVRLFNIVTIFVTLYVGTDWIRK